MLGNKKSGPPPRSKPPQAVGKPVDTIDTLVGQKAAFNGDLNFSGGLRIDGRVQGNVIARGDDNGTVVVSESGEIEGNIDAPHVIVNGTVNGNIKSAVRVELQANSRINGDVHYQAVEMALGAAINGNLVCDAAGKETSSSAGGSTGGPAGGERPTAGGTGPSRTAPPVAAKSG